MHLYFHGVMSHSISLDAALLNAFNSNRNFTISNLSNRICCATIYSMYSLAVNNLFIQFIVKIEL